MSSFSSPPCLACPGFSDCATCAMHLQCPQLTFHPPSRGGPAERLLWAAQATKEAEYRDKVADLKARIDSNTARRTAEQEHENTAKVECSPPAMMRCLHSRLASLCWSKADSANHSQCMGLPNRAVLGVRARWCEACHPCSCGKTQPGGTS